VPVVGLDAIGEEITSSKLHRAEVLKSILNLEDREKIGVKHVAEIVKSSDGGLKNVPHSSDVRVLLNKADTNLDLENGSQIAEILIQDQRIRSVLLASVKEESPVKKSISRVAGVILAAGSSTRLEGLKQLIPFRNKPLIAHSVEAALAGGLDPVVVVVRKEGEPIREALKGQPIHFVENLEPERGQSNSVKIGLEAVRDYVDAAIFFLADMPLVASKLVRALVEEHQRTLAPVIASFAKGRRGNPVLFDRQTFDSLGQLEGDQGGRAIFFHYPVTQVDWDDSVLFDVDSEEDLQKLREIE
jgi:molybdenum cofactor cytidylyltransferase